MVSLSSRGMEFKHQWNRVLFKWQICFWWRALTFINFSTDKFFHLRKSAFKSGAAAIKKDNKKIEKKIEKQDKKIDSLKKEIKKIEKKKWNSVLLKCDSLIFLFLIYFCIMNHA